MNKKDRPLLRTVPRPVGDDSVVHEDVSPDTIIPYIGEESGEPVCMACYKPGKLDRLGLCRECAKKLKEEGVITLGGGVV